MIHAHVVNNVLPMLLQADVSDPSLEFEFRIGVNRDNKHVSHVNSQFFTNVMKKLRTNKGWRGVSHSRTKDYFMKDRRLTINTDTNEELSIRKKKVFSKTFALKNSPFSVRIACSKESKASGDFGDDYEFMRSKDRMSFRHVNKYDHAWDYDLTVVNHEDSLKCVDLDDDHYDNMPNAQTGIHTQHEVELEVKNLPKAPNEIAYVIDSSMMKVLDIIHMMDPSVDMTSSKFI